MARLKSPPPMGKADPMARASRLAGKMAKAIGNEDVSDVALAVAILTGGIVQHYKADIMEARTLVATIRKLQDRIVSAAFKGIGGSLQ